MKAYVYMVGDKEYDNIEEAMNRMNNKKDMYLISIHSDGSRHVVYKMFIEIG